MSDARSSLLMRFSPGEVARDPPQRMARRRRLNLRIPEESLRKLRVIRLAGGIDQNTFCADVLVPAIDKAYAELKEAYDDAAWDVLTWCAERKR